MRWILCAFCISFLSLIAHSQQPEKPTPCSLAAFAPQQQQETLTIPRDQIDRARKKKRLAELLIQSIRNESTAINESKHAPRLDVKTEQEIRKLAKEITK